MFFLVEVKHMNNCENAGIEGCNTLYKLLDICEVRIPIIQRDYAQGRNNEKANEVRKRLLNDIIHVFSNNKQLDFNFVYGNKAGEIFYPVDGQQRLTTLYLLHWFLACRAGKEYLTKFNSQKKFSYMTRNSASEFFNLLKEPNDELCTLIKTSNRIKEKITDYSWFRTEWNNDPTVISALNMLNDMSNLEELKNNEVDYYEKLIDADSPAIYFKVLIENSENAETAAAIKYIRMNARGKVLTTFENVKAMLDGIDEKLKDRATKVIFDYDTSFIDIFYNKATEKNKDMDAKTEAMDKQTMCFFRNMYNVVAVINRKNEFYDDTSYANEMYRYSQTLLSGNEKFFEFYFNMMEAVLRVRKEEIETKKFIDAVFDENFRNYKDFGNYVAYFLYIYYLYIKHIGRKGEKTKFNVTSEKMSMFEYVLKNLMYSQWLDNGFTATKLLAEQVAEFDNVFDYFEGNTPNEIIKVIKNEFGNSIDLIDIKQRIIEQHIKAKIIGYKKYKYDVFNELEERSQCRKIQYLLWISGLWCENFAVNFNDDNKQLDNLDQYTKIALRYFMSSSNEINDLKWRKLFAIGGNWDKNNKKLFDSETINTSGNWAKRCYWDDKNYFWNDTDMPDVEKLSIVKCIYDLISIYGEEKLFNIVKLDLNNRCWLKYAVLRNHKELLIKEVKTIENKILQINVNGAWRKFMPYVLLLDKGYSIESCVHNLDSNRCVSGFGSCQLKQLLSHIVITLEADKIYRHTSKPDTVFHRDWRNYNITLEGTAEIKFTNASQSENMVYIIDENLYTIYQYQEESNDFLVYFYSISNIKNDLIIKSKEINEKLKRIRTEESNGNFDRILEIKNGADGYWKQVGYSRKWRHKELLEYELKKGNNHRINE